MEAEVVSFTSNSRCHYFLKGLTSTDLASIKEQTRSILDQVADFCKVRSMSHGNIIRTWLYIREMDRNYAGMSDTRSEVFHSWGMNEAFGYPASTGIGGGTANHKALVSLDAIILDGIKKEQLQKMEALSHMSHTMAYGVTFERGLKVNYGDRSHMYISGTASIDSMGNVLYPGDLMGQAKRSLENIRMLLGASDGAMDDVVYLIVYFRDADGAEQVDRYLKENLPAHIPYILLKGTVCRPGWLIEIEGVAISKERHPQYRDF
jgi:enamine deaminase RidA (YjgF/YER057c/UK114 family)